MAKPISITLIDDHTIVRNGLKSLIELLGDYKVTAEFDNGKDFIVDIQASKTTPDLVIMDMNMPVMNGAETMHWIKQYKPNLRVMILTLDTDEKTIISMFRLGVRGYLPKSCTAEVLRQAITDTMETGFYHSELFRNAMQHNVVKEPDAQENETVFSILAPSEMTLLLLVCDEAEYTYDQIAGKMRISLSTVDKYREKLFSKLKIKSKTGLVLFAIKHGLISV